MSLACHQPMTVWMFDFFSTAQNWDSLMFLLTNKCRSADDMPGTWGLDHTKKGEEEFVREFPTSITEMAHCQK